MNAPLIIASLLANTALAAVLAFRPSLAPAGVEDFLLRHFHSAPAARVAAPAKQSAPAPQAKMWRSVHDEDPRAFIARLRAAGFPPAVIRALVSTEISARYDERLRALQDSDPNTPFWKLPPNFYMAGDKRLEEMNAIYRERSKVLRDLFRDEFFASDDISAAQRRQFGDLSRSKIDVLQRIEDDYTEMMGAVRSATQGIMLPEDREKLALLSREKRTDLSAVLSPQELAEYELRTSPTTNFLRTRLASFEPSETEFRALFQAQVDLNEKFQGSFNSIDFPARQEATKVFHDQVKAAFGEARYTEYARETSTDFQQLTRLVQKENLPRETALLAYNLRDAVAQQSNRIFDDATLDVQAKRAALQTLAQGARNQILATLGARAGPEYVRVADGWLNNVERGSAVSFARATSFAVVTDNGTTSSSGNPEYRRLPPVSPPGR